MITSVQNINLAMLDMAVSEDTSSFSSVLSGLDTIKIYNPAPNELPDSEKAGKIRIRLGGTADAGGQRDVYVDGPLYFTPLSIQMQYTGNIFPRVNGIVSDEQVYFYTSEFHKFTKRTDVIGLAAKGQPLGFFAKGAFEEMIRTPMLNGNRNEFYEEKKDMKGKPYDGSRLDKKVVIYGIITAGEYTNNFFRMFINPSVFGKTYDAELKQSIKAEQGTIEHAMSVALPELNKILIANNRKAVSSIDHRQVDIKLTVKTNERGNYLPHFEYHGLVAMRGVDNTAEVDYIKWLREEHHRSIFGEEIPVATTISIQNGMATAQIEPPKIAQEQVQIAQIQEAADDVFGEDELNPNSPNF